MNSTNAGSPSASLLADQNQQKTLASRKTLTSPQKNAADQLTSLAADHGVYNLVGKSGAGKTVLAWCLVQEHEDWKYYPWLPVTDIVNATTVIIDNVAPTKVASRRAREVKTFTDVTSVIVLSQRVIPEATDQIHLEKD